jgi:hypothetical protein
LTFRAIQLPGMKESAMDDVILRDDDLSPTDDEIVAEVRAVRERLAESLGYDLRRLYERLKAIEADERAKGRVILSPQTSNQSGTPGAAA